MFAAGKTRPADFWREVRGNARRALGDVGVTSAEAAAMLDEATNTFAKTLDRGVVGSMVDYARMAKIIVENGGGLEPVGLPHLTRLMNRTPMSRLGMSAPEREARRLLRSERAG